MLASVAPLVARRLGARVFLVCALAPLSAVAWGAAAAGGVLDGDPVTQRATWVSQLGLRLDLRVDAFSLLMIAVVSGIGVLVFWYAGEIETPASVPFQLYLKTSLS